MATKDGRGKSKGTRVVYIYSKMSIFKDLEALPQMIVVTVTDGRTAAKKAAEALEEKTGEGTPSTIDGCYKGYKLDAEVWDFLKPMLKAGDGLLDKSDS